MYKTDIAISYYKHPEFVAALLSVIDSLHKLEVIGDIIVINDSPEDVELDRVLTDMSACNDVVYIKNPQNFGYTKSINQAVEIARRNRRNLLCINSDVCFDATCVKELIDVSLCAERIGFVFPRADTDENFSSKGAIFEDANLRRTFVPRFSFSPTAVGYCYFVCFAVLDRFGGFDELFSPGYEEENDLVMRAGALGYRAVVANHASVTHRLSGSFSTTATIIKQRHAAIIQDRHPHFFGLIGEFFNSTEQELYKLLGAINDVSLVTFDALGFPPVLNGTTIYAKKLIQAVSARALAKNHAVQVLMREDVKILLGISELPNLRFFNDAGLAAPSIVLIRIGQPFDSEVSHRARKISMCSINVFFDTIAQDISSLRSTSTEALWNKLTLSYQDIIFISESSRQAFEQRYPKGSSRMHVVYPSMKISEYALEETQAPAIVQNRDCAIFRILVVGNHFPHKDVLHTTRILLEIADVANLQIEALTSTALPDNPRLTSWPSGTLPATDIANMYRRCDLVLFPSYYEGFGMPILEALHYKKPVLLRSSRLANELIASLSGSAANIHCYSDFSEMFNILNRKPNWLDSEISESSWGWSSCADEILEIATAAKHNFSFSERAQNLRLASQN